MRRMLVNYLAFLFTLLTGFISCDKGNNMVNEKEIPVIKQNYAGIRIAWDHSSLVKIAPADGRTVAYCGYSRLVQLHDKRLASVYETSEGNVELVFSNDLGQTWSLPQRIFAKENNINMAVPDIIELSDHSILIACNPRPLEPYTEDRKFGIKLRKSTDGGENWLDEQTVYQAQSTFNNGCWEPSFAQLPDGEVQLFFSNEGVYTSSNEQNISILRSTDNGDTWSTEPEIAGFRQGRRDGMPVPLVLEDKAELIVAVEDNKIGEFKPSIYHEKINDNWKVGFVSDNDNRRDYHPLTDALPDNIYAGAPNLARLKSGEVLLSYQSTWNRSDIWDRSCMHVEIGNDWGTDFKNRTVPFKMPITKWGLWNSISVIENGTIPVAITSTNAYSYSATEVWMIKGHIIPEYQIPRSTVNVDANFDDWDEQSDWPYFIGHESMTNMKASICVDEAYLYVAAFVNNPTSDFNSKGSVVFQIDTQRKGYEKPHEGIFSFECAFDGNVEVKEGSYGEWITKNELAEIQYKVENKQFELAIPLQLFQHGLNSNMGVNFVLKSGNQMGETILNSEVNSSYTWCQATIE